MMNRLPEDTTRDEIREEDLFILKLDITIQNARPETASLSRTSVPAICQNQTEQLKGLIPTDGEHTNSP